MADSTVTLGVAGIAGTLLGVLSANGTTLAIERRKQRLTVDRERGESRRAARLVSTELAETQAVIETSIATRRLWSPQFAPSRAAWLKHQALLASELMREEYNTVSAAYVQLRVDMHIASDSEDTQLPSEYVEALKITQGHLVGAQQALRVMTAD